MLQHHVSSTYWTLLAVSLAAVAVVSFAFGYSYRLNTESGLITNTNEPDVTGEILNQQVQQALQPDTGPEAVSAASELHAYTGYVRSKTDDTMVVEKPDATTDWPDTVTFNLTDTTNYSNLTVATDSQGLPNNLETVLQAGDINLGDIVTVYCNENIRTADIMVATKIQQLSSNNSQ